MGVVLEGLVLERASVRGEKTLERQNSKRATAFGGVTPAGRCRSPAGSKTLKLRRVVRISGGRRREETARGYRPGNGYCSVGRKKL
jgi:hypothetical protein